MVKKVREVPADNVAVFVNGRAQNRAAVLTIPKGIIGAATEERNAEWSFSDDHTMSELRQ